MFFDKIFRALLSLLISFFIANQYGPEEYGEWTYAFTTIFLLNSIASSGIRETAVGYLCNKNIDAGKVIASTALVRLSISLVIFGGYLMYLQFINGVDSYYFTKLLLVFIILFQVGEVLELEFQIDSNAKYSVIAKNISFSIFSIIKIYVIYHNGSLKLLAFLFVLEIFFAYFILFFVYKKKIGFSRWELDYKLSITIIKESIILLIAGVGTLLYMRIDQLIIKNMLGSEQLGIYSPVISLAESIHAFPYIIALSVQPQLSKFLYDDKIKYKLYLKSLFLGTFLLGVFVFLIVVFSAYTIVSLFLGERYIQSVLVLQLYSLMNPFLFMGYIAMRVLLLKGLNNIVAIKAILGVILSGIFGFLGVFFLGLWGIVISAVFTQIFISYIANYFFRDTRQIFYYQTVAIKDFFSFTKIKQTFFYLRFFSRK